MMPKEAFMTRSPARQWLYAASLILTLGIVLRLLALGRAPWLDEYVTLLGVGEGVCQTWARLRGDTHHPLYFLLLGQWAAICPSLPFLRLLSLLFDVTSMAALMAWLRPIEARASLGAGLFFATAPMLLRFGVELRPYALLTLGSVLSFWATTCVVRTPASTRPYVALAAAWLLLVATHPIAVMLIVPLAAWPVLQAWMGHRPLRWGLFALAVMLPALLFGYLHFIWAQPHAAEAISWMPRMSWQVFTKNIAYLFIDRSFGVLPGLIVAQYLCWGALWAMFLRSARHAQWNLAAVAVSAGVLLLVALYSCFAEPIFWYRALLPAMVGLIAHMALHVRCLGPGAHVAWLALCVVQAAAWCGHAASPVEPAIGALLQKQFQPGDTVLYYPDFLRLYVRHCAPALSAEDVLALQAAPAKPGRTLAKQTVYLITRSDLMLAGDPQAMLPALQRWRPLLRQAAALELWVVPGHDDVLRGFAARFGEPLVLPSADGLLRWRFGGPF
jgi:hypothetical protein